MRTVINKNALDKLHRRFHRREFVSPDPLEVLYNYDVVEDREIAGLIASCLAYGRVAQILKTVVAVLEVMGPSPRRYIESARLARLRRDFSGFKYRFTTEQEMIALLRGAGGMARRHGSLDRCMAHLLGQNEDDPQAALCAFSAELNRHADRACTSLAPDPAQGSACKRLNLYLRWMVRRDEVDPGGWTSLDPAQLTIPLDTHMHRICRAMGLTQRNAADLKTAQEITDAFRAIAPRDPVKYDFAITRIGIRRDMTLESFLRDYHAAGAA
jgi:uncharacterized protein (TIGR02757 family)